ncbi:hypothetical protein RF11_13853 [Thelohanellus kitauei]|uniref:Uncharacterized protein n=1 Tax=Thelohanellus kitauei TaxID=669202 RepID=A0A0C2IP05_THEKT|nr:hypothetical protein RF11_13853 [Thelohanellus kitauei]
MPRNTCINTNTDLLTPTSSEPLDHTRLLEQNSVWCQLATCPDLPLVRHYPILPCSSDFGAGLNNQLHVNKTSVTPTLGDIIPIKKTKIFSKINLSEAYFKIPLSDD